MASLKEQISIIDEAYLAGIANKGIVNRAQKDLDTSGITVTLTEAAFADGTTVRITDTPANFKCSCPSRTVCKHAIMALLRASRNQAAGSENAEGSPSTQTAAQTEKVGNNFNYLLEYTREKLVKEFGRNAYNDAWFKINSGQTCDIAESSILIVTLMEGAFTARFLPGASLAESVCSCKTRSCRHRLEAVLQYIKHKTGKLDFELVPQDSKADTAIIPHVVNFIEDIFRTGLVRLPGDYSEKCSQFAVLCHGAGFAVFEKLFETCGRELALYGQKNAGFNNNVLVRNVTRIYQICREISGGGNEKVLAGNFRRRYMEMPRLRVMGLGANPWYAKSGFCGVTAIFYAPELKQTFNFSSSRPALSEGEAAAEIQNIWRSKSAWNLPVSLDTVSKAELSLAGAKISDDGRLSSSEYTSAALLKPQTLLASDGGELGGIVVGDFSTIKNLFSADPDAPRMAYAVLKTAGLGGGNFNRVTQTFSIRVIDKFENNITLSIPYSKINANAILNFEYLEQSGIIPAAVTVSIVIAPERFEASVFPVAVWLDGGIKNTGGEKLFSGDEKSGNTEVRVVEQV